MNNLKLYQTDQDDKPKTFDDIISAKMLSMLHETVKKLEKKRNTYPSDWPPIMRPDDVAKALSIARVTADQLFNRNDFPYIHVSEYRKAVGAQALWEWVNRNWPPRR